MSENFEFPRDFLWGAATASYQIEGSPLADGAGASIWHRFSHTPGNTANGDTGDVACDHYYRYASDVALMKELGLKAYRTSIAWGRIYPEGKGRINDAGVDFYSRLIDLLLENGIIPNITLYHWDLPVALHDLGGWLNPDIAHWFGDYASAVFDKFGDRVPMWATINEPAIVMDLGYVQGFLAPGHRDFYEGAIVTHNLLRSHGRAVEAYRGQNLKGQIGIAVSVEPRYEASNSPEDQAAGAAEAEMRTAMERGRALDERWHMRKNGTRFYASGVLTVLRRQGQAVGFAKIARDLTERKALEDALQEANDALEARVHERTAQLAQRNEALASEVRTREAEEPKSGNYSFDW